MENLGTQLVAAPRTATVLVVDDDQQIRLMLRSALSLEPGLRVVAVDGGEEGLVRAWEVGPTVILADLLMPGMDGATFCRLLRAHPATALTPIIALSGADPSSERARALRVYCRAWLGKPFDLDDLLAALRAAIASQPVELPTSTGLLSARQRQVTMLIGRGMSNREIASALVLEEGTVANHVRRILLKLGLRGRTQLALWAVERGLVPPSTAARRGT